MHAKICLIGAGNVGFHLAQRFYDKGHRICQIYSRNLSKITSLGTYCNCPVTNNLKELSLEADIYILATKDDSMKSLAEEISFLNEHNKIIAHTSGSVPSHIFEQHFDNYGVFYPLQTFSVQKEVNFEALPFCIYGNNPNTQNTLFNLALSICPNVYLINDQQRAVLHLTAVIVNNFSNFLFGIANEICQEQDVPFEILKPLIKETVKKIMEYPPIAVQTGPAVRGDQSTIDKHLVFLEDYPQYQFIYKILSEGIIQWKKKGLKN